MRDAYIAENRAPARHYLETELYQRVSEDPEIFDFLQNGSLDGVWYWDMENLEQEWMSPRFKALFGYDADEIPDTADWWQSNIHPDDLAAAQRNLERHKSDPSHPFDQIVRYRHKDGSTVWVRCRGLMIRDRDGTPLRMLGAHTDVTEMKRAEAELQRSNDELEQANATLRAFAATVSHDLKSPLRKVSLFSHMLKDALGEEINADAAQHVSQILTACDQANGIISALLSLTEVQRQALTPEPVDLSAVAREALDQLDEAALKTVRIDIQTMPNARGDKDVIRQIFANLIDNALKFNSNENPSVRVGAELRNSMIKVRVSDNGPGFPSGELGRLFEPLTRGPATASKAGGHGVGLAICRMAVERHGGKIELASAPEGGGVVTFTLPAAKAEHAPDR